MPISVAVTVATAEIRVTSRPIVGCDSFHERVQAKRCTCDQRVVELKLSEHRIADSRERRIVACCKLLQVGKPQSSKNNKPVAGTICY